MAAHRAPHYISPATQSMTVLVTQHSGGATVLDETVGLTPTSSGCTSTLTSTNCTLQFTIGPGTYDMTLATYDGYDATHGTATGTELSSGQTIGFTVVAGQANAISVTLSGIPAAIGVWTNARGVRGGQTSGFTQYGTLAQTFNVFALDADQNIIIGPGAPTFTIAASSGSGFTITNPTTASPNAFSLLGSGTSGQTESFTATAAYSDDTCSGGGAVCTTSFSVTSLVQTLFVSNTTGNSITVYPGPYGTPSATVTNGVNAPLGIATDSSGDLFVAENSTAYVAIYAPPYTGSPSHAGPNGDYTTNSVLIGPDNRLFADGGIYAITVVPPYTQTPTTITDSGYAMKQMSLDASGNLFIPNQNNNTVQEFAPPYNAGPVTTISNGVVDPQQTLVDPSGNLFVLNDDAQVTELAPPYTGAATPIGAANYPTVLAMDADANLFIAYEGNNSVSVYAKPYTGEPIATASTGINNPVALAIDEAGNLFVANAGNNTVTEYAPPYTGSPVVTISSGVNGPANFGLALYPH
ncbi:MAG TPA: hypothetical protein VMD91_13640 [Candidatus Sulfotelmatobacter sp.]|nr:hypothetical protein [Candidatus Sulfotelmatobacter sp.]